MTEDLHLDGGEEPTVRKSGLRFYLFLFAVLICFAGGAVFWHFSAKNQRTWYLRVEEGELVVRKGIPFPTGSFRHEASPAYSGLVLPSGTPFADQEVDSLQAVDAALFRLLTGLSREALRSGDEVGNTRARDYLRRASQLTSLDDRQEETLLRLRGELDLARGLAALKSGVIPELERALKELRLAQARGATMQPSPDTWIRWLETRLTEVREATTTLRAPMLVSPSLPPPPPAAPPTLPTATGEVAASGEVPPAPPGPAGPTGPAGAAVPATLPTPAGPAPTPPPPAAPPVTAPPAAAPTAAPTSGAGAVPPGPTP